MFIYDCIRIMLNNKDRSDVNAYESLDTQGTAQADDMLDNARMEGGSTYEQLDEARMARFHAYQNTQFT